MRQLRCDPNFAPLFRHVHPLCWWVLWWSLNRFFLWYDTCGYDNLLLATTRWGYVYPAFMGEKKPDPKAWRPYVLEKPRWDDPVWSTSVPTHFLTLAAHEAPRPHPNPPPRSGGGGSRLWRETEGACALAPHNTS
ncbi:hypothetical protein [Hyphomonas sp.]|uniref:hypothetical protein n=1 Tax=Hyphomonas sp. TaxID=87 RepID=UPI00391B29DF